uniref:Uncharacterized protein n=1 Tax=Haemonchus contortus TaxID=6289 RepID=A0A7I4YBE7_HAECO
MSRRQERAKRLSASHERTPSANYRVKTKHHLCRVASIQCLTSGGGVSRRNRRAPLRITRLAASTLADLDDVGNDSEPLPNKRMTPVVRPRIPTGLEFRKDENRTG